MIWLQLAWRGVQANGRRSLIAIGAVCLATVALSLYAGYINNVRAGLKYSFIHAQGVGHLQLSGRGGFGEYAEQQLEFGLTPAQRIALTRAADQLPVVRRLVPRLSFGGMVSSGARTLPFSGIAVDSQAEQAAFGGGAQLAAGTPLDRRAPADGVVLGTELARQLGVKPGDYVTVLSPTVQGALNAIDMTVVGIRELGQAQADLYFLQARLPTIQRLLDTDKISTLTVLLEDGSDVSAATDSLVRAATAVEARTWLQLSPLYSQVMNTLEAQFRVFGGLLIVATLMGLLVLIVTSVMERSREIGVMRSLGISAARIRRTFLFEGVLLCTTGLAAGALLGSLAARLLNAMHLRAAPPPGSTVGYPLSFLWDWTALAQIAVGVLALGALASWLGSTRATRVQVVDALGTL